MATEYSKQFLTAHFPELSASQVKFLAGSWSGWLSMFFFVPVELLKCRAQVKRDGKMSYGQEIRTVLSEQGVRGLYRGYWASCWRDVPGWGVYFWSYEWLKAKGDELNRGRADGDETAQRWREFAWNINAGGAAGVASWIVSIPQDIVKTKQQTHLGSEPLTMKDALAQFRRETGFTRLFKGASPIFMRGYIVNAITLPMYDAVMIKMQE